MRFNRIQNNLRKNYPLQHDSRNDCFICQSTNEIVDDKNPQNGNIPLDFATKQHLTINMYM